VKRVENRLSSVADYPTAEQDYGGDLVSMQEEASTIDDKPL
jgi:hypothetical protein